MQTNLLLNTLMSTAGMGITPPSPAMAGLLGAVPNGLNANGTLGEFAGLLGQPGEPSQLALLNTNNPTGDTNNAFPQAVGIALPVLGTYIDQKNPIANTVGFKNSANSAISLDSAKKAVPLTMPIAKPASNTAVASEVVNDQEFQAAFNKLEEGKISLEGLKDAKAENADDIMTKLAAKLADQTHNKKLDSDAQNQAVVNGANAKAQDSANAGAEQQGNDLLNKFKTPEMAIAAKEELKDKFSIESIDSGNLHVADAKGHLKEIKIDAKLQEIKNPNPAAQVEAKISQMVKDGVDMVRIKLHPAELGSVDIQMSVESDGTTAIRIIAERAETLNMLAKDSASLERALKDTGVKADAGSLQFSLRDPNQQQQQNFAGYDGKHQNRIMPELTDNYLKSANAREYIINLSENNEGVNILA